MYLLKKTHLTRQYRIKITLGKSLNTKKTYIYNEKRANLLLSPASTFKIPHTLIALNEGIISSDSIILWDKTDKGMTPWNKDQTLESAFKFSCVWCYKEFTSKIAASKYKEYLEKLNYGNKAIGQDVSDFWLDGSLKITAFEQVHFLKKLYKNDLPFEIENINTLKNIMIEEKNEINKEWFQGIKSIGLSAGASTPDYLID